MERSATVRNQTIKNNNVKYCGGKGKPKRDEAFFRSNSYNFEAQITLFHIT